MQFGPDFDAALEELFCEFLNKLEELVLIPDFKQVEKPLFVRNITLYSTFLQTGSLVPVH